MDTAQPSRNDPPPPAAKQSSKDPVPPGDWPVAPDMRRVGHLQQLGLARLHPLAGLAALALRTMLIRQLMGDALTFGNSYSPSK